MVKSLHFCTPLMKEEVRTQDNITTIRTGWIPQLFKGDVIKIMLRDTLKPPHDDKFYCFMKIISVTPVQFKHIKLLERFQEEINRYGKKFNDEQYFFKIVLSKVNEL